mgnify:CR=1 FL=1
MGIAELFLIGVGLSMDAFAVAICQGLCMPKLNLRHGGIIALYFGGFQALMPLIGWFLGSQFAGYIQSFDHWVAFALLVLIGVNMLKEALEKGDSCSTEGRGDFSVKTMFVMAVATSIDALTVRISLAMAGDVNIFQAVGLIGVVTFVLSAAGVKVGSVFGCRYEKKAQIAGGVILILLGIRILLEHMGIIE